MPWRGSHDAYKIWLSEIILQQTRVDQGTPYFERFVEAFPTVHELAKAPENRVMKLWEGLGYYSRARNLHKAAKMVSREMDGKFPETTDGLLELPGVGRYTAGAIASIAFGVQTPVVDGNVLRVFARLFDIEESTDLDATKERCWEIGERLVPRDRPGDFNQAVMELGAEVCKPRGALCGNCPLNRICLARAHGVVEERPVRGKKKKVPEREWVAVAVKRRGKYLLMQRGSDVMLGGLWEFPTGERKKREAIRTAAKRILHETTSLDCGDAKIVGRIQHVYSHFKLTMHVAVAEATGRVRIDDYSDSMWTNDVESMALHKAMQKAFALLSDSPSRPRS